MAKPQKKLTPEQKAAKKQRQLDYETIFINGKQKRVRRTSRIAEMEAEQFRQFGNDPIWLHQNGYWPELDAMFANLPEPHGG